MNQSCPVGTGQIQQKMSVFPTQPLIRARVMLGSGAGSVLVLQPLTGGHFLSFTARSVMEQRREGFTGDFSWTSWMWGLFWECGCSLSCGAEEQGWEGGQEVHGVGHKGAVVNARKRGCRSSLIGLSSLSVFVSPAWFPGAEKGRVREAGKSWH